MKYNYYKLSRFNDNFFSKRYRHDDKNINRLIEAVFFSTQKITVNDETKARNL